MNEISFERAQLLGLCGAIFLIVGSFVPVVHVPLVGGISLVANGSGDGVFLIILAMIAVVLLWARSYPWVLAPATGVLVICAYDLWRFLSLLAGMRSQIGPDGNENPFAGLATVVTQAIGLDWGLGIIFVGLLFLFASASSPILRRFMAPSFLGDASMSNQQPRSLIAGNSPNPSPVSMRDSL